MIQATLNLGLQHCHNHHHHTSSAATIFAAMAKFKWRCSEYLPVTLQATLVVFALVVVLSSVSFSLLPQNTWADNFSTLFFNVSSYVTTYRNASTFPSTVPNSSTLQGYSDQNLSSITAIAPAPTTIPLVDPNPPEYAVFVEEINEALAPAPAPAPAPAILSSSTNIESGGSVNSAAATSDSPSPEPSPPVDGREKFMAPLLSWQVGAGNQLMEYMSAAVMARALNRTLCLSPFFGGPPRHTGRNVRVPGGLAWEDRYEVSSLSRFTRVASWDECLRQCNYTLDTKWLLKPSREPHMQGWKKFPSNQESYNLDWDYVRWQSPERIYSTLGSYNDRCVGVAGLFPGLRWRGAFLAVSAFLTPAKHIFSVANVLQSFAIGNDTPYLAVHWRFEESECGSHQIGLCFVRCADGAVIDSGLHPVAKEWLEAAEVQCNRDGHFRGVGINKMDVIEAIAENAANHSVKMVYLATDGWLRGSKAIELVTEVVLTLRARGLTVVGLWKIPKLPNFKDGKYFDPYVTLGKENQVNGPQIALVEQEICSRAVSFMGSGQSTWSLAVFRLRLARRRAKQILEEEAGLKVAGNSKQQDELVINTLLKDEHQAGLHCRYTRYMKRAIVNETVETYADEYPDSWLDLEACEGRLGRGGHCQVAKCF